MMLKYKEFVNWLNENNLGKAEFDRDINYEPAKKLLEFYNL